MGEATVAAALERLKVSPALRITIYRKSRDRVLALIRAHRTEIAGMEFERGMTEAERAAAGITGPPPAQAEIAREKLLSVFAELNALLKFLPAEVRGKIGGFLPLVQGSMNEKRLTEFFLRRITERPEPNAGLSSAAPELAEQLHQFVIGAQLIFVGLIPAAELGE